MDGIDAALLETDGDAHLILRGEYTMAYDPVFKQLLHLIQQLVLTYQGDLSLVRQAFIQDNLLPCLMDYCLLDSVKVEDYLNQLKTYAHAQHFILDFDGIITHSTLLHAQAVMCLLENCHMRPADIDVIGYHGQTLFHRPQIGKSIIVGDATLLAHKTGIAVVSDFRAHDIRQGGQGAPFAPLYHQALAKRDGFMPTAVINCGGIANITIIPTENPMDLLGFDTGPGNGLVDRLVRLRTQGQENIDRDGHYGKQGRVDPQLTTILYQQAIAYKPDYFQQSPPKALDLGDLHLIEALDALSLEDACAQLENFTADTIVDSLKWVKSAPLPTSFILAGGGWHNPVIKTTLITQLQQKLGNHIQIYTADEIGWGGDTLEAQIFAYFAIRSLQGRVLSVPGTTGVTKPLSGGQLFPSPHGLSARMSALLETNPWVLDGYQFQP